MIETALFDVDGTLFDSNGAHAAAWHAAFAEFGYDIPVERIRPMIGMGGDRILPQIDPALHAQGGTGKAITACRKIIYLERYVASVEPTRGARDLLLALRERGIRRVIATSGETDELERVLSRADFKPLFDAFSTANDAPRSKPAPDIISAALERSGSQPDRAVMIGDTRYDVEAAHRGGVKAIALLCGGSTREDVRAADAIYADPGELLAGLATSALAA
ncbi:MAG: HAD family hydrolase [Candidatus Velthaea sp.]